MQRAGHAVLHALRIAIAKIAFCRHLSVLFKVNTAKRTCGHTHFAAHTGSFIHYNGVGVRVADKPFGWADFQAKRRFTLKARHGKNGAFLQINLNPNI
jgi:hypothetical protein